MAYSAETERFLLIEGWLRFCKATDLFDKQRKWLNDNYAFLAKHLQAIGLEQAKSLSNGRKYSQLNTDSDELLTFAIENNLYVLNRGNLCVVVNHLNKTSLVDTNNLNLKRIRSTKNEHVIAYVEQNIASCISDFSHSVHDEDEEALLFLLNNETIDPKEKRNYLQNQQNRIRDFRVIADEAKETVVKLFLHAPSWENIAAYFAFSENEVTESLKHYIEHYKSELGRLACEDTIAEQESLFDALIGSNILGIVAYKAIANSFRYIINSEPYLADLESDRLDYLIDAHKIAFTKENTTAVSSHRASTMARYLIHYKNEFLKDAGCITYSSELALFLLESSSLTNQEKAQIVTLLDTEIIAERHALANKICSLLVNDQLLLNEEKLITVIANSDNIDDRLTVVTQTIGNNPDNIDYIESLLQGLPLPYANIAVHDRKHPILERNNYYVAT